MIEVLKKGTRRTIDCNNCGAKLRYDIKKDLTYTGRYTADLFPYEKRRQETILVCPECGNKIKVYI